MKFLRATLLLLWTALFLHCGERAAGQRQAVAAEARTVAERIAPPPEFARVEVPAGSFGECLRHLPVRPGRPPVHLFDGRRKWNQRAHCAVVDLDVGDRDLQQCADA